MPPLPLGSITPRLSTPPLRPLLDQSSSYGYRVIAFARDVLREPLDPWQQLAVIRLGELLPDGRPRFRKVLILVARQNGKTHLCKVLALYWLYVERQALVFGTSTQLEQAAEAWQAAVDTAQRVPALASRTLRVRIGNGQQTLPTRERCRYKIGTANSTGGRGKTIRRAIGDELREQHNWEAYKALTFATNAVDDAQIVYITNQGDEKAVVLRALRKSALDLIAHVSEHGPLDWDGLQAAGFDPALGLLEWSAPDGSDPRDVHAQAAANPQLGRRMAYTALSGDAARVSAPGADPQERAGFLTEALCMDVPLMNPAIDMEAWKAQAQPAPLDPELRLAAVVDTAPNARHATLAVAAVLEDGTVVRGETVHEWTGPRAVVDMERDLPEWLARIRPKLFGWFPQGPAAAAAARLKDRRKDGKYGWPPPGVTVVEIKAELPAVCMSLAKEVVAGTFVHSGQAMLDAQARGAEPAPRGDGWVFTRKGGDVDALYAIAGAVHLARTLPGGRGKVRILTPRRNG